MATKSTMRNVVIDTDPGIDDAMALMMALEAHCRGHINIVGITLAFGNCTVQHGIKNLSAILSFFPQCLQVGTTLIKLFKIKQFHFRFRFTLATKRVL